MIGHLVQRLRVPAGSVYDRLMHEAADRIEALEAALNQIAIEAERPQGNWVHLKRVIGINARTALTATAESDT